MGRLPQGLSARTEHITARFRPATAAALDRQRGKGTTNEVPRSRHLERLVLDEERRRKGGE